MTPAGFAQLNESVFESIRRAQHALDRSANMRLYDGIHRLRAAPHDGSQNMLETALDAAIYLNLASMGALNVFDEAADRLTLAVQRGLGARYAQVFANVAGATCACGWALRHRQRIVVPDITHSPMFYGTHELECALDAGVRAVHATPLIDLHCRAVGVLTVHFRKPHTPEPGDLSRMDTLALIVATEVSKASGMTPATD